MQISSKTKDSDETITRHICLFISMYTSGPSDKNPTLEIFNWTIFFCKHLLEVDVCMYANTYHLIGKRLLEIVLLG